MIDKVAASAAAAVANIHDGATVMLSGFGTAGMPATFERGINKGFDHLLCIGQCNKTGWYANNIGVIVHSDQFSHFIIPTKPCPDALVFISRNSHAVGTAAN